ncbi:hypothetical protein NUW54_g10519 [Trametes sanguinea]|uniref:Uncharacterized protein n=1 Tax=Trametes sanguinea TaxID=158606 RepID=A0ACC1NZT6_9APHY|nr:hypothetical protein NUW54_g10519 [Trametes sanguinea]
MHERFKEDCRHEGRRKLNVVRILADAFRDIQEHGIATGTDFAEGWMAPIYKEKGELSQIVNYRPITLLNTDYKLLTKVLALRLASVATDIIHPAQAGFMPGRRLRDQTQLAKVVIEWTEVAEVNGALVALDQEKAYDKIAHDYLWAILDKFGIPKQFSNIVKALYGQARTSVAINGVTSEPYVIYRGVRQGDPLSCLLFDLAIEPLSEMIRSSELEGINVPQVIEAIKAKLFADDTAVYLGEADSFETLQRILDLWCSAAKAKFNINKTEIIPLGTKQFRAEMIQQHRELGQWKDYPPNARMAAEGEQVRILGAFIGNGIDPSRAWDAKIAKVTEAMGGPGKV